MRHRAEERQAAPARADRPAQGELFKRAEARVQAADAALRALPSRLIGQIHRASDRVAGLAARSDAAVRADVRRLRSVIVAQDRILQSLSYRNVLQRGFALVRDAEGGSVRQAAAVTPGMALSLEFADGRVSAIAGEGGDESAPQTPAPRKKQMKPSEPTGDPPKQGSLF